MITESTPQKRSKVKTNLGDSFASVTPIRPIHSCESRFTTVFADNKNVDVGGFRIERRNVTHLQNTIMYSPTKNNRNIQPFGKRLLTDAEEVRMRSLRNSLKRKKNDSISAVTPPKPSKRNNCIDFDSMRMKEEARIQGNGDCVDILRSKDLFDCTENEQVVNEKENNVVNCNEICHQEEDLFADVSAFQTSVIDKVLDHAYDDEKAEKESNASMSFDDSFFHKVALTQIESSKKDIESENDATSHGLTGLSRLFKGTDIENWNNESMVPDEKEAIELNVKPLNHIKQKLLENAGNASISKTKASGWTQIDDFNDKLLISEICSSQFHELGPFHGLPSKVKKLIEEHKGIKELYSWQEECLSLPAVKRRRNLVYALPTNGGKTLVAEVLILRELLCFKKNVLFILPFVSIVQEKVRALSHFALELGFLVEEYAAGKGAVPPRKRRRKNSVLIATIEKGLSVVHSLLETKRLNEFGLIVVDELHLLAEDSGRGAALETLLTHVLFSGEKIHVIGMSATIGNLDEIAQFLDAESYAGSFRPVRLFEYVKCGNTVYSVDWKSEHALKHERTISSPCPDSDPDGIGALVQEVVPEDSVLVFCPTKKNCENVALLLCSVMSRSLTQVKAEEKASFYRALTSESNGKVCPVLKKTIPYGVAYHHSGLTADERKLLEEAFRVGTLCVICCTSTLAAGVNLPARRVILRSPYVGKDFISLSKYKQMIGRAGRAGLGAEGESYLICQAVDCEKVGQLLRSKMDESLSKLDPESCKSLVLSAIGLGVATTRASLRRLFDRTLLHVQEERLKVNVREMADNCIIGLFKQGALKVANGQEDDDCESKLDFSVSAKQKHSVKIMNSSELTVSRLGKAAMKGGMTLQRAHLLYSDLAKAQSSLGLLSVLHLLYLVTPYDSVDVIKPNYSVYFNVCMQLTEKEVLTADLIGISEFTMSRLYTGVRPKNVPESIIRRFYITLILNEMWKQQGVWEVALLFQVPRGLVQNVMSQATSFAQNVLRFCEELQELWPFKALLTEFAPRLAHCCAVELLPLMDLPAVKQGRAKQLYNAGFKTLSILANAKPSDLVQAVDHMPTRVASQIIAGAKMLLLEKAENLREEAEDVLEGLVDSVLRKES